jgi:hypothetical protein
MIFDNADSHLDGNKFACNFLHGKLQHIVQLNPWNKGKFLLQP